MGDFKLDNERILSKHNYSSYNIQYWIYDRAIVPPAKDVLRVVKEAAKTKLKRAIATVNHSCFADFPSMFAEFVKLTQEIPNRLIYQVLHNTHTTVTLDATEIERWVNVCKEKKLMPARIGPLFLRKKYYIVGLETINAQQLYLYLCAARYIQEEPYFVRTMLYLLDEGLDFYIAFTVASRTTINNCGHAVLPIYKGYGSSTNICVNNTTFNLNYARKLRVLTQESIATATPTFTAQKEEQIKQIDRMDKVSGAKSGGYRAYSIIVYNLHNFVEKAVKNDDQLHNIPVRDLKDEKIIDKVYS
jgi:hypothetical protein